MANPTLISAKRFVLGMVVFMNVHTVWALDGANPVKLTTHAGWSAFELVTQHDAISSVSDPIFGATMFRGNNDGIGIYRVENTLSIALNHERTSGAAISRVDVNRDSFRQMVRSTLDGGITPMPSSIVSHIGFAYDSIYDGTYHAATNPNPVASGSAAVSTYGNSQFSRFCSGSSFPANNFGAGRGFADAMYITGEEVSGGHLYALDFATRAVWDVSAVGIANWENAALIDTGTETHVGLIVSSDVGSGAGDYIRLYVGEKNVDANSDGQVDFLERNGLRGGTVYYFVPEAGASSTDLPDGTVSGTWSTSTVGALRETKLEDVHTSPFDGSQFVMGAQLDGVYSIQLQLSVGAAGLNVSNSSAVIQQIRDDDIQPINAPDNVNWSSDGFIYVQEDGSGNGMFQMSADGINVTEIATANSEPSGIFDVSNYAGYAPGSVILTSIQGTGSSGGQLTVLLAPSAMELTSLDGDFDDNGQYACDDIDALVAEIVAGTNQAGFDLTQDGIVDQRDLASWLAEAGAAELPSANPFLIGDANLDGVVDGQDLIVWNANKFTASASWCSGDFTADGVVDGQDYIRWNANKFRSSDAVHSVPEPTLVCGMGWIIVALSSIGQRR